VQAYENKRDKSVSKTTAHFFKVRNKTRIKAYQCSNQHILSRAV